MAGLSQPRPRNDHATTWVRSQQYVQAVGGAVQGCIYADSPMGVDVSTTLIRSTFALSPRSF